MTELILRPLADAFMEVGVFVALLVAPFGWARYRWGARLDDALVRHARLGPVVGAALTIPPGCGGAIIVMAVYARGAASFGTAVAALTATMGDASWVLLAAEPVLTLKLKVLVFLTGAGTGYIVDALGIAPRRRVDALLAGAPTSAAERRHPTAIPPSRPPVQVASALRTAAVPTPALLHNVGVIPVLFWLLVGTGFTVSLPITFQVLDPAALVAVLGGLDLYLVLGVGGTLVAAVAFALRGFRLADDDRGTAAPTSMSEVMRHGAYEVAFVTVWVAAAYVAWEILTVVTGFDGSQLPLMGLIGVVVGALVGLIPGCGIQIVFMGIFLAGGLPLPTLIANTLSQDGDALIPLLALEHRSAALATCLTTVPALLVGSAALLLL